MNNILITFSNALDPESGGVERVYHNLVPYFRSHGYNVYAVYQKKSNYDNDSVYSRVFHMAYSSSSVKYFEKLEKLLLDLDVDIIICPFPDYHLFNYFSRLTDRKIFFHIHNVPSKIMFPNPAFLPAFLKNSLIDRILKRIRFNLKYLESFKRIEKNNMKVILLSSSFEKDLRRIFNFKSSCILSVPNPICIDNGFELDYIKKEKMILYVGRINKKQKRFESLLNIWEKLQYELPDYRLEVVGGGPEKEYYENMAHEKGLKRVIFNGFKNPKEFYQKAECLCMTSNYEGFGMVLVEAMQYGCVPFAFNSFESLIDIIDDTINGYVISPFKEDEYALKVKQFVLSLIGEKEAISLQAIQKSKNFDICNIGQQWLDIIENYKN